MQQIVYDFTSSQTQLEKSFQLLHLLDFCLLHYLLCKSDSKSINQSTIYSTFINVHYLKKY